MEIEADSNRVRRIAAWGIDACVVGIPAVAIGLVVPIVPVGALAWVAYRLWAGWHGRSIGRSLTRLRLRGPNGAAPRWRGVAHTAVAAAPVAAGVAAVAVQLTTLSLEPWYLWLFALPFIFTLAAGVGALVALVVWTGGPRVDRWCGVAVRSTRGDEPRHAELSAGVARGA